MIQRGPNGQYAYMQSLYSWWYGLVMFSMQPAPRGYLAKWPVALVWALAWMLMQAVDGTADIANLALILVLASATSGLWLSALESVVVCAFAVMAFNWHFVPPRGTFSVDLRQHAWLLLVMLGVGSMVAWLMGRQRRSAESARSMAEHANLLRSFGEQLRTGSPEVVMQSLAEKLQALTQAEVFIGLADGDGDVGGDPGKLQWMRGQPNAEDVANLRECLRTATPGSFALKDVHGYHAHTLPLRGQNQCHGAALLKILVGPPLTSAMHATAQALCDQTGLHLERTRMEESARQASDEAKTQKMRNTLLAAISHDYRTPLANILGAASSLVAQSERLSREQARTLATTIVDEVERLSTMTNNTLQLARLDADGVQITKDWESLEELIGSAVARARSRYPDLRVGLRIEPNLPLLRCDALLVMQLLDNLVDNAVKHGGGNQTVELIARNLGSQLMLSVADRGPGIPAAARERMFLVFERGSPSGLPSAANTPRGTGLGLALCRAIVQAHGGTIQAKSRQRGGTSMDCLFPVEPQSPAMDAPMVESSIPSAGDL